jgi:glutathione S-transferase
MITLFGFGPKFGLPEPSPYVIKTEVQLKLAGLAYRKDPTGFGDAPKGKLPYIVDDGEAVADSTFIRAHIERKYGIDLDAGLGPAERAQSWAIERMLEDHLGWALAYDRWLLDENFARGPAHFFDQAPEGVRDTIRTETRERVRATQKAQGMGRHSAAEVATLGTRSLDALSTLLGERPYLMGAHPTGTDATALGLVAGLMTPIFDSPLCRAARERANLVAYAGRMMARFYPEFAWG